MDRHQTTPAPVMLAVKSYSVILRTVKESNLLGVLVFKQWCAATDSYRNGNLPVLNNYQILGSGSCKVHWQNNEALDYKTRPTNQSKPKKLKRIPALQLQQELSSGQFNQPFSITCME